jgi:hypothetical protein
MPKLWRIFFLLNGIGVVLFTFGTIDGNAITQAFTPVGIIFLLPAGVLAMALGRYVGKVIPSDEAASFIAALVTVALNGMVWILLVRSRQRRNSAKL